LPCSMPRSSSLATCNCGGGSLGCQLHSDASIICLQALPCGGASARLHSGSIAGAGTGMSLPCQLRRGCCPWHH
jgi:hypothetical protein